MSAEQIPLWTVGPADHTLARVRDFHDRWGQIDIDEESPNPQRLWEELDDILNGGAL